MPVVQDTYVERGPSALEGMPGSPANMDLGSPAWAGIDPRMGTERPAARRFPRVGGDRPQLGRRDMEIP